MKPVLLDTHVWAWGLLRSTRLSPAARAAIDAADQRLVSAASLYEISQKCRIGRWPEMEPIVGRLTDVAEMAAVEIVSLDAKLCLEAGRLVWAHRDPFDRLIAATTLHRGADLISADAIFDGIVPRIW